jgi:hypothetical protein
MSGTSAAPPGAALARPAPRWRVLFTPRWLSWHLFAVVAFVGMLWLGDWQFRRAMDGNALSWAYTFEWPVFSVFGAVFWVKTVKDELHPAADADAGYETLDLDDATETAQAAYAGPAGAVSGVSLAQQQLARARSRPAVKDDELSEADATELAEYNAYLAKLGTRARD